MGDSQNDCSIRQVIFEELPKDCFPWRKSFSNGNELQKIEGFNNSFRQIFFGNLASHFQRFPTKKFHLKFVLKDYLRFIEDANAEVPMDIREEHLKIDDSKAICSFPVEEISQFDYRTFFHPDEPEKTICVIKNSNLLISSGTTGLSVWPAALALVDFFYFELEKYFSLPPSTTAVEIGTGTGISGLFFSSFFKHRLGSVFLTDTNEQALRLLSENIEINNIKDVVSSCSLDWCNLEDEVIVCSIPQKIDILFASDIVYDPDLFPGLVLFFKRKLIQNPQIFIVIAACIRNEDTWASFTKQIQQHQLSLQTYVLSRHHFSVGLLQYKDSLKIIRVCAGNSV